MTSSATYSSSSLGFKCICREQYTGVFCEIGKNIAAFIEFRRWSWLAKMEKF
jgi:hypothetical protein